MATLHTFWPPHGAMLWLAALIHSGWGLGILLRPGVGLTTPLYGVFVLCGRSALLCSAVLTLASLATLWLMVTPPRPWHLCLGAPQQGLLLLSAYGCLEAAWLGRYADGTPHDQVFILIDQLPAILTAALHSVALWRFHAAER